jgi:hypothetical protein
MLRTIRQGLDEHHRIVGTDTVVRPLCEPVIL